MSLLHCGDRYVSQTSLLLQMALAQILHIIRRTNWPAYVGTSGTNTLRFPVHNSATDVVWSTAAASLTKICKVDKSYINACKLAKLRAKYMTRFTFFYILFYNGIKQCVKAVIGDQLINYLASWVSILVVLG